MGGVSSELYVERNKLYGLDLYQLLHKELHCRESDDTAKYRNILCHLSFPLVHSVISSLILFLPH